MSPKQKPGKTKAILEAHAKDRAEERLGISLNHDDRREIVKMIQTDHENASFIAKTSTSRTLWKVNYEDTNLNVVYDKTRHALCSVLPTNAVEFQVSASVNPTSTTGCIECKQSTCACPGNWSEDQIWKP